MGLQPNSLATVKPDRLGPGIPGAFAAIARGLMGLSLATVTSCVVPSSEDLDAKDDDVVFPALRISREVERPEMAGFFTDVPELAEGVRGSVGVDLDLSYGQGTSSQDVRAGRQFVLDDLVVDGPARISHEFRMWAWSVAARGGFWVDGIFGLEGFGGLAFEHLQIKVKSDLDSEEEGELYTGPLVGAQLSLNPFPWMTVFSRGSITFGFLEELHNLTTAEAGVSFTPRPHFSLFAAWRWWDLEVDRSGESDFEIEMDGPVFGLQVNL